MLSMAMLTYIIMAYHAIAITLLITVALMERVIKARLPQYPHYIYIPKLQLLESYRLFSAQI